MEIILVRHGHVDIDSSKALSAKEFEKWVQKYNDTSISKNSMPCSSVLAAVRKSNLVISSDYIRAIDSAKLLSDTVDKSDPLYREADLPALKIPLIRWKPGIWAVISRIAWLFGYSNNIESIKLFQNRINIAVENLIGYSKEHSSITLVAHGFTNKFIAKQLSKIGWEDMTRNSSSKNWGYKIFQL